MVAASCFSALRHTLLAGKWPQNLSVVLDAIWRHKMCFSSHSSLRRMTSQRVTRCSVFSLSLSLFYFFFVSIDEHKKCTLIRILMYGATALQNTQMQKIQIFFFVPQLREQVCLFCNHLLCTVQHITSPSTPEHILCTKFLHPVLHPVCLCRHALKFDDQKA
jgi:hypothetical protein